MIKFTALFFISTESLKTLKYQTFSKNSPFSVIGNKWENEDEKVLKQQESPELLKVLGLKVTLPIMVEK